MTNKEAIEYLKLFHGYDLPIQEALNMAIEALEEPKIIRCADCKYWSFGGDAPDLCMRDRMNPWYIGADGFCSFAVEKGTKE